MKFAIKTFNGKSLLCELQWKNTNQKERYRLISLLLLAHEQLNISGQLKMAELTPLAAAQAEVDSVSGILKDNLGKVKMMEKVDGWRWWCMWGRNALSPRMTIDQGLSGPWTRWKSRGTRPSNRCSSGRSLILLVLYSSTAVAELMEAQYCNQIGHLSLPPMAYANWAVGTYASIWWIYLLLCISGGSKRISDKCSEPGKKAKVLIPEMLLTSCSSLTKNPITEMQLTCCCSSIRWENWKLTVIIGVVVVVVVVLIIVLAVLLAPS